MALAFWAAFLPARPALAQLPVRQSVLLDKNWQTIDDTTNINAYNGFQEAGFSTKGWITVDVPHNWDTYGGYRRLKRGNLHGYAWYRKIFYAGKQPAGKHYFLWFEGVSSYATVWLNGKKVGYHAGGRTSFTIDVTPYIKTGAQNLLCVRADHPAFIRDLPWVSGGDSDDPGFSEGSQPMGIFRPVHLIVTNALRIEPFGVHMWNDTTVTEKSSTLHLETFIKNYGDKPCRAIIVSRLIDTTGHVVASEHTPVQLKAGDTLTAKQTLVNMHNVRLWWPDKPYLYTLVSQVMENGKVTDQTSTAYGIRWISWPIGRNNGDNRFYVNGKPFFINGIAEYEHLMGNSHAFSHREIRARVMQFRAAGFNAFRDAHQPHNLEYQKYWEKLGILWWPQFTAHIWFDTPQFRENFKKLLRDWIIERRNNPSVILWGLQNESRLPKDFAQECSDIIRQLDPTASSQRKITTCNGGEGTDWNVPQNWSGTYGGDPLKYADELQKDILVGEYGAWRSLDLHTGGPFMQNGPLSEDRMSQLMELKVRLAESVRDKVAGQFAWVLYSHENPGRVQNGEGWRNIDRVGPVNYKGLFTIWGQPVDAFYMFRSNYAPKKTQPMVYIVSHDWPNRWLRPGVKDSIIVYSNCDSVALFNDVNASPLGVRTKNGRGTHFEWEKADIRYNLLYAVGYVGGRPVAKDYIELNHLPAAPHLEELVHAAPQLLKPAAGYNYLYRVNCGGPNYTDTQGNLWMADVHKMPGSSWGSLSWTDDYNDLPAFFGSQQRNFGIVQGTEDGELFRTFRFGMKRLRYEFPVPDGDYRVELYFEEPWYGAGGGMDCSGWRVFDVAVNGKAVIHNLDIWKKSGYNHALKETVNVHVSGGNLEISFPKEAAGEAVISAIAISTLKQHVKRTPPSEGVIGTLHLGRGQRWSRQTWLDIGDKAYTDAATRFSNLPPAWYGADWIRTPEHPDAAASFKVNALCDIEIAIDAKPDALPAWMKGYLPAGDSVQTDENGGKEFKVYKKRFGKGDEVTLAAGAQYTVAVLPVTKLAPAVDLRPVIKYAITGAATEGNAAPDTINGKKVLRFKAAAGGTITFNISPGLAGRYALRIKYHNDSDKTLSAMMQIVAADGTVMKKELLHFKPIKKKNKTGTLETGTSTSINAGNYKVILQAVDADGLAVSGLEMQ